MIRDSLSIKAFIRKLIPESLLKITWLDDIASALGNLVGKSPLSGFYTEVAEIRKRDGRSVPKFLEACVRKVLDIHPSDLEKPCYNKDIKLLMIPHRRGEGIWALRNNNV